MRCADGVCGLLKYCWRAARSVEMSKALPEYSLANGGLEEQKWGEGRRSLERGSSKERSSGAGGRKLVKFLTLENLL